MRPLLALLLLAACTAEPITTNRTDNPEIALDLLLTSPEGCKVYRFEDEGRHRYFAACPNATVMSSHTEAAGKMIVTVPEEVSTVGQ